jgi:hypothetical protein
MSATASSQLEKTLFMAMRALLRPQQISYFDDSMQLKKRPEARMPKTGILLPASGFCFLTSGFFPCYNLRIWRQAFIR